MGALRLILAIAVVIGHANGGLSASYRINAYEAVNAFFIISGFYMALVLNEKYRTSADNNQFLANRFLRIYPTYYVGIVLAIIVYVIWYPGYLSGLWSGLTTGGRIFFVLSNLAIFGQDLAYLFCVPHQRAFHF